MARVNWLQPGDPAYNWVKQLDTRMDAIETKTDVFTYDEAAVLTGSSVQGQLVFNTKPIAEGNVGWVCVVSGFNARTAWAVSTPYVLNDIRHNDGKVYRCSKSGTSADTGTGPDGTGATAIEDGTAEWMYVGTKSTWLAFGDIAAS